MTRFLAGFLGVFSIVLGLIEMFAPRQLAEAYNMEGKETLIMAFGGRELAAGVGILSRLSSPDKKLAPWLRTRVAGDALDLTALAAARSGAGEKEQDINTALAAVAGITLLDILCANGLS